MEKATSTLRRSGAFLLSYGTRHQELNLIISDLKGLKSQVKVIRDSHKTIYQDLVNWTCVEENRALQELFLHLSDLNSLWSEVQSQFAEQISEFKHHFEMFLEGERNVDALRDKLTACEDSEKKAVKKLKKAPNKEEAEGKIDVIKAQKELIQAEVAEKVKENEAVKLIRVKDGFLKLSEAYLDLSHKCICIFEAQRDIVKCLPDVKDKDIHEVRFDGLSGAKDILQRAVALVKECKGVQRRSTEPPPPYSPAPQSSEYSNLPYNPYYLSPVQSPEGSQARSDGPSGLYPTVEELSGAVSAAKI